MSKLRPRHAAFPQALGRTIRLRGIAFPLLELAGLRQWAAARRVKMTIQLDRVTGDAHDEEVVWLGEADRRGAIALWRTASGIICQHPEAPPSFHPDLSRALAAIAVRRSPWIRQLFSR